MKIAILTLLLVFCGVAVDQLQAKKRYEVLLETTSGNIRLQLYNETPLHRDNFLRLVEAHYYDSLLFHRVIKNFMIQCGDSTSRYAQPSQSLGDHDLDYTIQPEIRLPKIYHRRGVLAAAREPDEVNPNRESSASHFYIVWGKRFSTPDMVKMQARLDTLYGAPVKLTPEMVRTYKKIGGTPHLDGGYTVFGEVVEGLEVVERIQLEATDEEDRPYDDVRILRASVVARP